MQIHVHKFLKPESTHVLGMFTSPYVFLFLQCLTIRVSTSLHSPVFNFRDESQVIKVNVFAFPQHQKIARFKRPKTQQKSKKCPPFVFLIHPFQPTKSKKKVQRSFQKVKITCNNMVPRQKPKKKRKFIPKSHPLDGRLTGGHQHVGREAVGLLATWLLHKKLVGRKISQFQQQFCYHATGNTTGLLSRN